MRRAQHDAAPGSSRRSNVFPTGDLHQRAHLLAGPVTLFGAVFFAFGSLGCFIFLPATDPFGAAELSRNSATAAGWLTKVEKTNFNEGGGSHSSGTPVYRYEYAFRLPDGGEQRGTSYVVGQVLSMPTAPEASAKSVHSSSDRADT